MATNISNPERRKGEFFSVHGWAKGFNRSDLRLIYFAGIGERSLAARRERAFKLAPDGSLRLVKAELVQKKDDV